MGPFLIKQAHIGMTFLNSMGVAVTVTCGPELADVILNTTGRAPNSRYGVWLIGYEWTHEMDGRPGSANSKEARSLTTHD